MFYQSTSYRFCLSLCLSPRLPFIHHKKITVMKKRLLHLMLFVLLFSSTHFAFSQGHETAMNVSHPHIMLNEKELNWKVGPASLPPGSKIAVLEGDMSQAGPFTVRLQLPSHYKISPHFHPAVEHVTVIDGSFYMGTGNVYNEAAATQIKKGGFAVMPVGYAHFAFTKGTTIIQLHGVGPWGITYVNEADDPRKSKQ